MKTFHQRILSLHWRNDVDNSLRQYSTATATTQLYGKLRTKCMFIYLMYSAPCDFFSFFLSFFLCFVLSFFLFKWRITYVEGDVKLSHNTTVMWLTVKPVYPKHHFKSHRMSRKELPFNTSVDYLCHKNDWHCVPLCAGEFVADDNQCQSCSIAYWHGSRTAYAVSWPRDKSGNEGS